MSIFVVTNSFLGRFRHSLVNIKSSLCHRFQHFVTRNNREKVIEPLSNSLCTQATINIESGFGYIPDKDEIAADINRIRKILNLEALQVDIHFVSLPKIKELKRELLGIHKITDIISSSLIRASSPEEFSANVRALRGEKLGIIHICPHFIMRRIRADLKYYVKHGDYDNQGDRGCSKFMASNFVLADRMNALFIHSFLHLIGYDHENNEDWLKMTTKEDEILKKFLGSNYLQSSTSSLSDRQAVADDDGRNKGEEIKLPVFPQFHISYYISLLQDYPTTYRNLLLLNRKGIDDETKESSKLKKIRKISSVHEITQDIEKLLQQKQELMENINLLENCVQELAGNITESRFILTFEIFEKRRNHPKDFLLNCINDFKKLVSLYEEVIEILLRIKDCEHIFSNYSESKALENPQLKDFYLKFNNFEKKLNEFIHEYRNTMQPHHSDLVDFEKMLIRERSTFVYYQQLQFTEEVKHRRLIQKRAELQDQLQRLQILNANERQENEIDNQENLLIENASDDDGEDSVDEYSDDEADENEKDHLAQEDVEDEEDDGSSEGNNDDDVELIETEKGLIAKSASGKQFFHFLRDLDSDRKVGLTDEEYNKVLKMGGLTKIGNGIYFNAEANIEVHSLLDYEAGGNDDIKENSWNDKRIIELNPRTIPRLSPSAYSSSKRFVNRSKTTKKT